MRRRSLAVLAVSSLFVLGVPTHSVAAPGVLQIAVSRGGQVMTVLPGMTREQLRRVKLTTTGRFAALSISAADGRVVYAALSAPGTFIENSEALWSDTSIPAGTYRLNVMSDGRVSAVLPLSSGSSRRVVPRPGGSATLQSVAAPPDTAATGSVASVLSLPLTAGNYRFLALLHLHETAAQVTAVSSLCVSQDEESCVTDERRGFVTVEFPTSPGSAKISSFHGRGSILPGSGARAEVITAGLDARDHLVALVVR